MLEKEWYTKEQNGIKTWRNQIKRNETNHKKTSPNQTLQIYIEHSKTTISFKPYLTLP